MTLKSKAIHHRFGNEAFKHRKPKSQFRKGYKNNFEPIKCQWILEQIIKEKAKHD